MQHLISNNVKILGVRTDCVYGIRASGKISKLIARDHAKPGEYSEVPHDNNIFTNLRSNEVPYEFGVYYSTQKYNFHNYQITHQWNPTELASKLLNYYGFTCMANAGCGKTTLLEELQTQAIAKYGADHVKAVVYTRSAASMLKSATTLHDLFKIPKDSTTLMATAQNIQQINLDVLLIDEVGMIGGKLFANILRLRQIYPRMKIFMFGDLNQLPPVNDDRIPLTSNAIHDLTNGNNIELVYNFRNGSASNLLRDPTTRLQLLTRTDSEFDRCHITYTNYLADKLNKIAIEKHKFPKPGEDSSIVRLTKTIFLSTQVMPKNGIFRVVQSEKKYVLTQLYSRFDRVYTFTNEEFDAIKSVLEPGYAFTVYKSQGLTIPIKYTIHEYNSEHFSELAKYTAVSRCVDPKNVKVSSTK
jgi:hypothetical protein